MKAKQLLQGGMSKEGGWLTPPIKGLVKGGGRAKECSLIFLTLLQALMLTYVHILFVSNACMLFAGRPET